MSKRFTIYDSSKLNACTLSDRKPGKQQENQPPIYQFTDLPIYRFTNFRLVRVTIYDPPSHYDKITHHILRGDMKILKLTILDGLFTIHRLKPNASLPKGLTSSAFYSISGSSEELSIVAPDALKVESDKSEPGWAAMRIIGTLDFAETGIVAELSGVLAKAGLSVFVVSTFDTDYILVKDASLKAAREALTAAGHKISKPRSAKEEEEKAFTWKGSAAALLETQIPLIKKLLIEKIGPSTLASLRSTTTMAVAVGGIYEFLPTAVRLVVNRELFVSFCVAHLDQILPQAPAVVTPKKTAAKVTTTKKTTAPVTTPPTPTPKKK